MLICFFMMCNPGMFIYKKARLSVIILQNIRISLNMNKWNGSSII